MSAPSGSSLPDSHTRWFFSNWWVWSANHALHVSRTMGSNRREATLGKHRDLSLEIEACLHVPNPPRTRETPARPTAPEAVPDCYRTNPIINDLSHTSSSPNRVPKYLPPGASLKKPKVEMQFMLKTTPFTNKPYHRSMHMSSNLNFPHSHFRINRNVLNQTQKPRSHSWNWTHNQQQH